MIAILKYLWTLRFYLLTHYDQRCVNTKFHLQFFFFFLANLHYRILSFHVTTMKSRSKNPLHTFSLLLLVIKF